MGLFDRLRSWKRASRNAGTSTEQVPETAQPVPIETAPAETAPEPGLVRGRPYQEWTPVLDRWRSEKNDDEALKLLLEIVPVAAAVARATGTVPALDHALRAAVIHRRRKEYAAEIAVLEEWRAACPAGTTGAAATKCADRLVRARELLAAAQARD